ncbi:MAG: pre-peptidase C-terminal domain-containing protein, partial [Pirellula sp.]|nr:pre-peptidase C-terminal domain-containing protein [Pirellula sp.]
MATFGFGSGSSSSNRVRKDRSKIRKVKQLRRSMLETLEVRNLMTTGPDLIGVQPNEGSVLALGATSTPTVLNVSPRELVLRFGDGAAIDVRTLGGIQIKRAGADGALSAAYLTTDLGTNGAAVLDFSASLPGQQGNGTEIRFTQSSRTSGINGKPASFPIISVSGQRINIDVNIAPGFKTTAGDLVRAMREDASAAALVVTSLLRGNEAVVVADTVPTNRSLPLIGADSARASTNFNSGNALLQAEFVSVNSATTAAGIRIEFTSRSFDVPAPPNVLVSGQTIRVELNSNPRAQTSVQEVLNAINGSREASALVVGRMVSGSPFTRIGGNPTTYSPLILVGGDDQLVTPAFIGLGDTGREVIVRFGETLPDDRYLIDIIGSGPFALRDMEGFAFNGGVSKSVRFDLDLGPTVQAVVPQPVVTTNGTRQQLRNVIYVYFNGDKLNAVEAVKPLYYQLVHTADTLFGGDDVIFRPTSVNYDANLNRVALSFDRNLDELVDPANPAAGPLALSALRLRIGNDDAAVNTSVANIATGSTDPGDRFDSAFDLGGGWLAGAGAKSAVVSSEIRNTTPYVLDYPGANDEPSNRNSRYQQHITRVDTDGIEVVTYNFASTLGTANQSVQLNAITDTQKVMVRQVISLYERYFGARFVESDNQGFTIAVGDMQAIDPATALTPVESNRPGGLTYAAGPLLSNPSQSAVIIDSQDFNTSSDNVFGSELFRSFMRGIGVLLGLGNADELPQPTIQNNSPITDPEIENVFPGNADIIHGQFLFRPEGRDIDLYRFTLPAEGGKLTIQVAAERQTDSSLLDAALRLYRNDGTSSAPRWVELSANDDYFSKDPRIELEFVTGGEYMIGVSAKGNTSYDPSIADSGLGGRSEGRYDLRIDYRPPAASSLVDANGLPTALDGDGDGRPGGVFNYWFVPTRPTAPATVTGAVTLWVDKAAANGGNGTLAAPINTISAALTQAGNIAAQDPTGKRIVSVRILGNSQNRAYEIGFNRFGQPMADGASFDVPRNVNVMIDAGAIIKMGRSRISVGSSTVSVNRSGGTLQLLGVPDSKVIVTSLHDRVGVGVNPDLTPPAAAPGDWGGIDFRNRIDGSDETRTDKERAGLFLNAVIHSDIRFGGGQILADGVSQVITPINIVDSRPTIANSLVTRSADAAMSATPNSFKEDDYRDPRSQAGGGFVPDYERIGPDIRGNRVVDNTINGLFVKTRTGAAETLETITVAARFNEIDIPYVLGENLVVAGTPGGGILDVASPPSTIVVLTSVAGGSLAAGTYNYRIVYVDANGNESLASTPTDSITVADNSSIS